MLVQQRISVCQHLLRRVSSTQQINNRYHLQQLPRGEWTSEIMTPNIQGCDTATLYTSQFGTRASGGDLIVATTRRIAAQ